MPVSMAPVAQRLPGEDRIFLACALSGTGTAHWPQFCGRRKGKIAYPPRKGLQMLYPRLAHDGPVVPTSTDRGAIDPLALRCLSASQIAACALSTQQLRELLPREHADVLLGPQAGQPSRMSDGDAMTPDGSGTRTKPREERLGGFPHPGSRFQTSASLDDVPGTENGVKAADSLRTRRGERGERLDDRRRPPPRKQQLGHLVASPGSGSEDQAVSPADVFFEASLRHGLEATRQAHNEAEPAGKRARRTGARNVREAGA